MRHTPDDERAILRLLVERGLVDDDHVARFDDLSMLVRRGLVDEAAVRRIEDELGLPCAFPADATEPVAPRPPDGGIPPELLAWDRYRVERLLGRGGSGTVYLARDTRLDRPVAVKLLSAPSDIALREARLQARVAHDGVCKVYEVGFLGASPFVVMQYVDGETLAQAARRMTRERLVAAVRDAAEAVHAAHALGLVHRDLKPGNLMIERGPEAQEKTYVLDFGLAKEVASDSTMTGSVLGTPAFMAPEQARGDVRRIDRRTDVYGLGATLYDALCDQPPFPGSGAELLAAVLAEEPVPLRRRDATISPDLEAIVHACLEKDPARRYPSARALAEDLSRYLSGTPVEARRLGPITRLFRRARRHRALAAASAISIAALAGLGAAWVRDRIEARERAEAIRYFTEQAESIESVLRLSHLSPLHDTRPARREVRARLLEIERAMAARGPAAEPFAREALGRGYLSLQDYDEARIHLEIAQESIGPRPALAFALARTYGALYERGLHQARSISDPRAREETIRALERDLRDPAILALQQAGELPGRGPELVHGYFAYHEGRSDEAIAAARAAAAASPWLYEARKLEGDVHGKLGQQAEDRGQYDQALSRYTLAAAAYSEAAAIGRSDAEVQSADCRVRAWAVEIDVEFRKVSVGAGAFEQALAACDRSIETDADRPGAWEQKARVLQLRASANLSRGQDPTADLDESIRIAEDVTLLFPDRAGAFVTLGLALTQRAQSESAVGKDARDTLARAIRAGDQAVFLEPTLLPAYWNMGNAYRALAEEQLRRGADPRPALASAVQSHERALSLDPTYSRAWNNIGRAHALAAEHEIRHGLSARASIDASIRAYEKAALALPDTPVVPNNLGLAWSLDAFDARSRGEDPRPSLARAKAAFDRAVELSAAYAFAWKNRADAHRLVAEYELFSDLDPTERVRLAVSDYGAAALKNPRYAGAHRGEAAALLVLARYLVSSDRDPAEPLSAGRAALDRAHAAAPGDGDTLLVQAGHDLLLARVAARRGADPGPPLAAAETALQAALAAEKQTVEVHALLAEVHLRRARRAEPPQAEKALEAGIHAADEALRINPLSAPAHAVRGALFQARSEMASDPEARDTASREARAALEKARAIDRLSPWRIRWLSR